MICKTCGTEFDGVDKCPVCGSEAGEEFGADLENNDFFEEETPKTQTQQSASVGRARFCTHCGHKVHEDAVVCVHCGCGIEKVKKSKGLEIAIKVFMLIGMIFGALYTFGISLCWCIPMTVYYFNKVKKGEEIGTGFKVCSLLFVNTIAGILMLVDNN